MLSNKFYDFMEIVIVMVLILGLTKTAEGGSCWARRFEDGTCKQLLTTTNITRDKCCSNNLEFGYIENELTQYQNFMSVIGNGIKCIPCLASCETAKCSPNKRCVIRNGLPKCICSPACDKSNEKFGASKKLRNKLNLNIKSNNMLAVDVSGKLENYSDKKHIPRDVRLIKNDQIVPISRRSEKIITISAISDENSMDKSKSDSRHSLIDKTNVSKPHRNRHANHRSRERNHDVRQEVDIETKIQANFFGYDSSSYSTEDLNNDVESLYNNAVCGTDGRTYKSECQLKKKACRRDISTLGIAYQGQCQNSCKLVRCPIRMHCIEDQNLMPHCVNCSMKCPPYDKSLRTVVTNPEKLVCGIDGQTYRNLCEIRRTTCLTGRSIAVAYRGPCLETANCNNIKCKARQICLNDLVTQRPRCVACGFKCPRSRKRQQSSQQYTGRIKICGSNNVTYHSWCQMMKDSCSTRLFIDVKNNGPCRTISTN